MTGLSFSSANHPRFASVRPHFGGDEKPAEKSDDPLEEKAPAESSHKPDADGKDSFTAKDADKNDKPVAAALKEAGDPDAFSLKLNEAEEAQSVTKADGDAAIADPQQAEPIKKDFKYWIKSAALSAVSIAMLAASLGFLALPGGFIISTGLALGAFLVHDYTNHLSRKTGLLNVTDPEKLKALAIERGQRPLELLSRLRYPFNPERQSLWVNNKMHLVHSFDPHKQLSRTGLDYQSVLDKMKAETSYLSKTFIMGRFLFTAILKRGLFRFMQSRGRVIAWIVPVIWAWITGNKHGKLDDPPPQAPQPIRTFGGSAAAPKQAAT